jgi:hypothetical protein
MNKKNQDRVTSRTIRAEKQKVLSSAEHVRRYIGAHPAVKECLRRNLINHSALASEVCTAKQLTRKQGVLAAVRRYALRLSKQSSREMDVEYLFNQSRLIIRNNVCVVLLDKSVELKKLSALQEKVRSNHEPMNIIEGEHILTVIIHQSCTSEVRALFKKQVLEVVENLAQISVTLPRRAMYTQGVSARLSSVLAQGSINIVEELTCSGEYLIIINEVDLVSALTLLSFSERSV